MLAGLIVSLAANTLEAQEEYDLKTIAEFVAAYQKSIETLEVKTSSRYTDEPAYSKIREADPTAWGPDVIQRTEYAEAPAGRKYFKSSAERNGITFFADEDYKVGDIAYDLTKADVDPKQTIEVVISRNFRGEAEGVVRLPDILMGFILVDGRPLHRVLADDRTRLIGKTLLDEVSCYQVEAVLVTGGSSVI